MTAARPRLARHVLVSIALLGVLGGPACGGAEGPPGGALADAAPLGDGASDNRTNNTTDAATEGATEGATEATRATAKRRDQELEVRATAAKETPRVKSAYEEAMTEGEAALYSADFDAARTWYQQAMVLRPKSSAPALGALRALAVNGRAAERASIERRLNQKIAHYRERPQTQGAAYLLSARVALALGEIGKAMDESRMAVSHLSDLGVAWRVLGEAAMAAELWTEAVESFQTAVALGLKAESGTWERMADALDELGELEAAEETALMALDMTGREPHARRRRLNLLAVILKHRADIDGALKIATEAQLLGPRDPAVLHNLGSIAEERGRPEEALALYDKALATISVPTTLWRKGKLLLQLDRPNDAVKAFAKAAANLSRWNWPASTRWLPNYEVGKLYARAKHYSDAVGWFEDALREARTAPATREIVSWLAYCKTLSVDDAVSQP